MLPRCNIFIICLLPPQRRQNRYESVLCLLFRSQNDKHHLSVSTPVLIDTVGRLHQARMNLDFFIGNLRYAECFLHYQTLLSNSNRSSFNYCMLLLQYLSLIEHYFIILLMRFVSSLIHLSLFSTFSSIISVASSTSCHSESLSPAV